MNYRRAALGSRDAVVSSAMAACAHPGADSATDPPTFPAFDRAVPAGGYAWWYIDAFDTRSNCGLAIIAFVGSVFSPYYAWARRHTRPDPLAHCAINVGLYRHGGGRLWSMTERGRASVARTATSFAVGPSALRWDGTRLRVDIDELTAPLPRRLRGTVVLQPRALITQDFALEPSGGHRWCPYLPEADVEVDFKEPALRWRGKAYGDCNAGDTPLENAFLDWQWTRAHPDEGRTVVTYDARPRAGGSTALTLAIERDAVHAGTRPDTTTQLPTTFWGIRREVSADPIGAARVLRTLESGPFYARSLLEVSVRGSPTLMVHESLSLQRFARPIVQLMLPWRMPRALHSVAPREISP